MALSGSSIAVAVTSSGVSYTPSSEGLTSIVLINRGSVTCFGNAWRLGETVTTVSSSSPLQLDAAESYTLTADRKRGEKPWMTVVFTTASTGATTVQVTGH